MAAVGTFATVLLALAVLLLLAAEWPRIAARFGGDARASRARTRRKGRLTVIEGEAAVGEEDDDFAASVERDLANLPVIEERDDRSRR
jgi:hypothetical protein